MTPRQDRAEQKSKRRGKSVNNLIAAAEALNEALLRMCNAKLPDSEKTVQVDRYFKPLLQVMPCALIIPLQHSLTASLAASAADMATHKPFPSSLPHWARASALGVTATDRVRPRE